MPDLVYGVDPTALTLVELAAPSPNLMVYTLRPQVTDTSILEMIANFAGQELAVLYVRGRGTPSDGVASSGAQLDVQINGTSFLSSGSPTTLHLPDTNQYQWGFSPLWQADLTAPPLLGTGDLLSFSYVSNSGFSTVALDVVFIPSSQLSLVGG